MARGSIDQAWLGRDLEDGDQRGLDDRGDGVLTVSFGNGVVTVGPDGLWSVTDDDGGDAITSGAWR
jgi:hypothetical protein